MGDRGSVDCSRARIASTPPDGKMEAGAAFLRPLPATGRIDARESINPTCDRADMYPLSRGAGGGGGSQAAGGGLPLHVDDLVAARPHGDEPHRCLRELLEPRQVRPGGFGEVLPAPASRRLRLPPGE